MQKVYIAINNTCFNTCVAQHYHKPSTLSKMSLLSTQNKKRYLLCYGILLFLHSIKLPFCVICHWFLIVAICFNNRRPHTSLSSSYYTSLSVFNALPIGSSLLCSSSFKQQNSITTLLSPTQVYIIYHITNDGINTSTMPSGRLTHCQPFMSSISLWYTQYPETTPTNCN